MGFCSVDYGRGRDEAHLDWFVQLRRLNREPGIYRLCRVGVQPKWASLTAGHFVVSMGQVD